jgi:hypothetical protein
VKVFVREVRTAVGRNCPEAVDIIVLCGCFATGGRDGDRIDVYAKSVVTLGAKPGDQCAAAASPIENAHFVPRQVQSIPQRFE